MQPIKYTAPIQSKHSSCIALKPFKSLQQSLLYSYNTELLSTDQQKIETIVFQYIRHMLICLLSAEELKVCHVRKCLKSNTTGINGGLCTVH